ncbi:MAG: universal stress protein [Alphaproteobacteria bacterium]|nr:universal stress protein [Alphaproteobacteria bacterium]
MYKKILLAYDGSPEYRAALRQGAELAEFCKAEVHLLAVITSSTTMPIAGGVNPSDLVNEEQREIRSYLEEGVERLRQRGIKAEGRLGYRDPVDEINATAREIGADLIVVGHRRRNTIERWWRKSTSKSLLMVAPCDVLVSSLPPDFKD